MLRPWHLSYFLVSMLMQGQGLHLSEDRLRAHIKYLASDALEGRGVGTRGETLATDYLAAQLQAEGLQPAGDNGSYFQRVDLIGATTKAGATLSASGKGKRLDLELGKDFVGTATTQQAENDFAGEAVFVGHGIVAPQYGWNDYKGENLKGKVLIYFTNEPASQDAAFFGGPALTYFGRWTYKFEEAARQGAAAAIIVHTTPTAGYGWQVVQGSNSKEHPQLVRKPGEPALQLAAWVTEQAGAKLLASTGMSLNELLAAADKKTFRPIHLGVQVTGHIPVELRQIPSRNVVARVEGSGTAEERSHAVMYTAHWDHLGVGIPVNGDRIYNGAVDNATGCAMVLEVARLWAALPEKPKRSALFALVTAEESGLLGSQYFGTHPVIPISKIEADLNYDALYPFGKTRDVSVTGAERTTLWPIVQADAKRLNIAITPDPEPGQGSYYRSDHFSLARVGVPSFSIEQGSSYYGKPADFAKTIFEEYNGKHYHQPSDEYRDDWDVSGMVQMGQLGLAIGLDVANSPEHSTWQAGDEFLPARQSSK